MRQSIVEDYAKTLKYIDQCRELAKTYKPGLSGEVEIRIKTFRCGRLDCYLSKQFVKDSFPVPLMRIGSDLFMSITPMELQSHINPIKWATGHVITAGLGLGYFVNAVRDKEELDSLTVFEKNLDVIKLYLEQFGDHPKVIIKNEDIFNVKTTKDAYDYLYVDIWPNLTMRDALTGMSKIVQNINVNKVSFWGMERGYCEDPDYLIDYMESLGCNIEWAIPDMNALFRELLDLDEDDEAFYFH